MVYAQPRIIPREWEEHNSLGFSDTNRLLNSGWTFRFRNSKRKRTCRIVNFAVTVEHQVKNQRKRKKTQVPWPCQRTKWLWNMVETVTWILICPLETSPKGLVRGMEELENWGRAETVQSTEWSWSVRIVRRVLETWENLWSLRLLWKTLSKCRREKLDKTKIMMITIYSWLAEVLGRL